MIRSNVRSSEDSETCLSDDSLRRSNGAAVFTIHTISALCREYRSLVLAEPVSSWRSIRSTHSTTKKFLDRHCLPLASILPTMTTAADRRRIPGPASSYPALPLAAYTSHSVPTPTPNRTRNALEARKLCTLILCLSDTISYTDRFDDNCSRLGIHRNIVSCNSFSSLNSWSSAVALNLIIYPDPSTQHRFLPSPFQRRQSSSKSSWSSNPNRKIPGTAPRKINK